MDRRKPDHTDILHSRGGRGGLESRRGVSFTALIEKFDPELEYWFRVFPFNGGEMLILISFLGLTFCLTKGWEVL
jgi:hypothetical protein